jgi:hypothetical protein
MREHAAVAEPGGRGDPISLWREHRRPVGRGDRLLGVREVAAKGGLTVGRRGSEPWGQAARGGAVVEQARDGRVALVVEGLGRHREPGVVARQRDDSVRVFALDGVGEAIDRLALGNMAAALARGPGLKAASSASSGRAAGRP